MNVPFFDLQAAHAPLRGEISGAIEEVIDAVAFAGGPFVSGFEERFAEFCGVGHAVGVGSGTDALWLALLALGIGPGDEVITVPMTFIATAAAITRCGAKPVFVDIDERTFTLDVQALEGALSPRTRAVVPVHLFGQMAEMQPILEFARRHGLAVVEDAAQAHGASYAGGRAGSLGDIGCFSFYPGKNLGALGEAGMVVTGRRELAEKVQILRDHGQQRKYHHTSFGWNCRMDGIQAAVLQVKLRTLERNNQRRREHAARYSAALRGLPGVRVPATGERRTHVHHIYALRVARRREFMRGLERRGIGCAIHYPVPVHLQPAYAGHGLRRGSFPVSEQCADEFVSLPMYPELGAAQVEAVIDAVREAAAEMLAAAPLPGPLVT